MTEVRILVTGGAGYIGSHVAKELAGAGFVPVVVDDLSLGRADAVKWGPLVVGNLMDSAAVAAALDAYRPAAVMHFAASAYVSESVVQPARYYRNNVANTLGLLDAMLDARLPYLIFSSTCATYGLPECLPMDEGHPQAPINPYGHSKLFVEGVLRSYEEAYGLKSMALRYFNAAGADPEGAIGENHQPETHLVPLAVEAALGRRAQLAVHGTDFPTRDGSAVRDYVHVSDIARAHVLALEHLLAGGPSLALNLGTGAGQSVLEVASTVERVTGSRVPLVMRERRPGDPHELVANADLAHSVLGWTPERSGLDEIVETAWRWMRSATFATAAASETRPSPTWKKSSSAAAH